MIELKPQKAVMLEQMLKQKIQDHLNKTYLESPSVSVQRQLGEGIQKLMPS